MEFFLFEISSLVSPKDGKDASPGVMVHGFGAHKYGVTRSANITSTRAATMGSGASPRHHDGRELQQMHFTAINRGHPRIPKRCYLPDDLQIQTQHAHGHSQTTKSVFFIPQDWVRWALSLSPASGGDWKIGEAKRMIKSKQYRFEMFGIGEEVFKQE